MLMLNRAPGEAIIIGGEIRVGIIEIQAPMVRLGFSRLDRNGLPLVESPAGREDDVDDVTGQVTLVQFEGQPIDVDGTTIRIEDITGDHVTLFIDPPGDVNVFGEEVWDILQKGESTDQDREPRPTRGRADRH